MKINRTVPIIRAEFIKSAVWPDQYPLPTMPEVAFAGRSNVGKSSLINALVGRRNLAKTSNTPGRTQLINFFSIDEKMSFVDLPGYGFAKVPRSVKKDWGEMIEAYLKERQNLALIIFILDVRRDPSPDDLNLRDWLDKYSIPYVFILTKADKLSHNQALVRRQVIARLVQSTGGTKPILFSVKTGEGKDEIWQALEEHLKRLPE